MVNEFSQGIIIPCCRNFSMRSISNQALQWTNRIFNVYTFEKKQGMGDEPAIKDANGEEKYWFDDTNFSTKQPTNDDEAGKGRIYCRTNSF